MSHNSLVSPGLLKGLAAALLAGCMSVGFMLVALLHAGSGLMFLVYFTAVPLYLAGLGAGALAGIVASVAGTIVLYATQPANIAVIYILAYAMPSMTIIRMALRKRKGDDQKVYWYPEGKILTAITLYPCILFLIAAAVASSHPGGLLAITQDAFSQASTQFAARFGDDEGDMFRRAIVSAATIAPAMISYSWILVTMVSLAGAQYILKQHKWNLRESFSILHVRMPIQLIYAVAATGLVGVLVPAPYDYIGRNLGLILGFPFFFVGIAVIHSWLADVRGSIFVLTLFYVLMVAFPLIVALVALLGVIDQWADFRQRMLLNKTTD